MPPPRKRQKTSSDQPSEIIFDSNARQEYLTGFHKRKLARAEYSKELAIKKAREEKIEERRQLREQKKQDVEAHVRAVNQEYRKLNPDLDSTSDEDDGEEEDGTVEVVPLDQTVLEQEEEFVDEEKYTTVTVEPMLQDEGTEKDDEAANGEVKQYPAAASKVSKGPPKKKKKKFRYESKAERKETRFKQKAKNRKAALARKGDK